MHVVTLKGGSLFIELHRKVMRLQNMLRTWKQTKADKWLVIVEKYEVGENIRKETARTYSEFLVVYIKNTWHTSQRPILTYSIPQVLNLPLVMGTPKGTHRTLLCSEEIQCWQTTAWYLNWRRDRAEEPHTTQQLDPCVCVFVCV